MELHPPRTSRQTSRLCGATFRQAKSETAFEAKVQRKCVMQADGTQVTGCRLSVQRLDCDTDKLGQFRIGADGKARKCTFIKALRHAAEHMHAATVHIPDVQNPVQLHRSHCGSQCGITGWDHLEGPMLSSRRGPLDGGRCHAPTLNAHVAQSDRHGLRRTPLFNTQVDRLRYLLARPASRHKIFWHQAVQLA